MSKCYDNPEYDDTYSDIQNTWNQHPKVEQEHETKVMKNLHILPTDKPSRLACDFDKLILNSRLLSPILYKTQNIYIASDEEINQQTKPCWCINTIKNTWDADLSYYQGSMPQYHYKGFKKINIDSA